MMRRVDHVCYIGLQMSIVVLEHICASVQCSIALLCFTNHVYEDMTGAVLASLLHSFYTSAGRVDSTCSAFPVSSPVS